MAAGAGAIWVAASGEDAVIRIDPSTSSTITIPVGDGPTAVAFGNGSIWVANSAGGTISRIDLTRREVVETIEVGNAPSGLAVIDDFVWVAVQAP